MTMTSRTVSITSASDIGAILRLLRKETGHTQREMAGLCNVSLPFLNQVEQGKPTAQIGKVLEVCRRHGIEVVFNLPAKPDDEGK
jgi:transcriptional regulator with XRE-family HTH domain